MQGLYVDYKRPSSKKAVKEAAASNPASITIEATSFFGDEYDGPVIDLPVGQRVSFVGPDPHTSRKFYGTLVRRADGKIVVT